MPKKWNGNLDSWNIVSKEAFPVRIKFHGVQMDIRKINKENRIIMGERVIENTEWGTLLVKQTNDASCDVFQVKSTGSYFLSFYDGKFTDTDTKILDFIEWKIW